MNQHPDYVLNKINGPKDLKKLSFEELSKLPDEMRQLVLEKDAAIGGHVGPNLGIMEMTTAFHYVFDAPKDKIVFDVSHQSYGHKMLTGRKNAFLDPDCYNDVTGYTNPDESEYDCFTVGHTSTSVSLATGLAQGRDLLSGKENIVAIIGDGSLSGGLAFEGFNNASVLDSNLIIVINDNQMSIDENKGGFYRTLKELRETNGQSSNNIFKAMGFEYRYLDEGNDLKSVIELFESVKDVDHPVVLHVNTLKGKGYEPAEKHKMEFHWHTPWNLATGESATVDAPKGYADVVLDVLEEELADNVPLIAINAAIPGVFGLKSFEAKHPVNYLDVGIAEQHSLTVAAGMAKAGARPVVFQNSTFLQRAYDQLSHDVALNDLPVVMLVFGGTAKMNSNTHLGMFDIPFVSSVPNVKYLMPASKEELRGMLKFAIKQTEHPIAIRIPTGALKHAEEPDLSRFKYQIVKQGTDVAVLALGQFIDLAKQASEKMIELGIDPTIINPLSVTEFDSEMLDAIAEKYRVVITLEDGSLDGGFGQKIAAYFGAKNIKVIVLGAKKGFPDMIPTEKLHETYGLLPEQIAHSALQALKN